MKECLDQVTFQKDVEFEFGQDNCCYMVAKKNVNYKLD